MNYKDFYKKLFEIRIISNIWEYELELITPAVKDDTTLELLTIYFSLIDSGNVCMSLNEEVLNEKWISHLNNNRKIYEEKDDYSTKYEPIFDEIIDESNNIIKQPNLDNIKNIDSIVGNNKLFEIDKDYLYTKKYNYARKGINASIKRLFKDNNFDNKELFKIEDCSKYNLSEGQKEVIKQGLSKNLIVTGGPGTGKTTSILFILLYLLKNNITYNIYLAAASGKAASRMKESILKGLDSLKDEFRNNPTNTELLKKISGCLGDDAVFEEFTIHRLLSIDSSTGKFRYNLDNQFDKNSIFIIDEASMIDINLFNSLLNAIPTGARIFVLGDKNQLPSVEAGAVFAELIKANMLIKNKQVVEIKESKRFGEDTEIYKLSLKVNDGLDLDINESDFNDYKTFYIYTDVNKKCPVYYFKNEGNAKEQDVIIKSMIKKWVNVFFANIIDDCINLNINSDFGKAYSYIEHSKILSAENDGVRGVKTINDIIKRLIYNKTSDKIKETSLGGQFVGQVMMINTNNKSLDLYNGDSGILVSLENNKSLFFMVKKKTRLLIDDLTTNEQLSDIDDIFKIGDYVFYPFRFIAVKEIDLAYAITIHKSQGSDYNNLFVILPPQEGHPLLNRQIVYTAITRTKGYTYILSNLKAMNAAKDTVLTRDTNLSL